MSPVSCSLIASPPLSYPFKCPSLVMQVKVIFIPDLDLRSEIECLFFI